MKRIKLSISDDSGNIDFNESPIWKHSRRLSWVEVKEDLNLVESLITRLRDWKLKAIKANKYKWWKEEQVKCEIEGLAILLELRKELPDYEITYSSNFNSYNCVFNEEQYEEL